MIHLRSIVAVLALLAVCGCARRDLPQDTVDLATARTGFVTSLHTRGPAPQPYEHEAPPPGVQQVSFTSGSLQLKGWLSDDPNDEFLHPAVVYLHGGFAFGSSDWHDASPFRSAGFVVFTPMLRGENGNPGVYEAFYGEVDDAIAAGNFVASLPYVDPERVFIAGHSTGAIITCLSAMLPSPYKAAASFDGSVDMGSLVFHSPREYIPFDSRDRREINVRNPGTHASSLQIPIRLFFAEQRHANHALAKAAQTLGKDCQVVPIIGDHFSMLAPAIQQVIPWFQEQMRTATP